MRLFKQRLTAFIGCRECGDDNVIELFDGSHYCYDCEDMVTGDRVTKEEHKEAMSGHDWGQYEN